MNALKNCQKVQEHPSHPYRPFIYNKVNVSDSETSTVNVHLSKLKYHGLHCRSEYTTSNLTSKVTPIFRSIHGIFPENC